MISQEAGLNCPAHPLWAAFSDEEIAKIVELKRYFEWIEGDLDFREAVESGTLSPEQLERLDRIGIAFRPEEVPLAAEQWGVALKVSAEKCSLSEEERKKIEEMIARHPLLSLWARYIGLRVRLYRERLGTVGFCVPQVPKFEAWRQRRIAATRHELGFFAYVIDHPILAFELGDGCSVGCWFCAFSTRKLTKNFDYVENRELFRKVAQTCVDLFGREQAAMALLYYGTEPHDNPHYLDFVKDYEQITGYATCTSTAVCTDTGWIRELIAFYRPRNLPWPRLSVLSRRMLHEIHDLYSPEELRDVELLMQMKSNRRDKVTGGRILKEHEGLREREEGCYRDGLVPQGSIACVTGFLINLVHQRIRLVSPCYTSKRWPYGYRVFDEMLFEGPDDFGRALREIIDRAMAPTPLPGGIARFRDDLVYRETPEGFDLVSPNQVRHFRGPELYGPLGKLLAQGKLTFDELHCEALDVHRLNPLLVAGAVREMFARGFLDEVMINGGHAPLPEPGTDVDRASDGSSRSAS